MIWHSATKFGCGKARSRSGKVIAVAYYEPKGNIPHQFHENVFPPVIESDDEESDSEGSSQGSTENSAMRKATMFFKMISCQ